MSAPENLENIAKNFNIDIDFLRGISAEEIRYLVDRCPFVQIVCPDENLAPQEVEILKAKTDWPIHFYGDAMSSSPGPLIFNTMHKKKDYEGDFEQSGGGKGTLIKQAWDTAEQMVEIAKKHGWTSIHIADGHPLMMRAIWIHAEKLALPLTGFTPNEHDKQVRRQLALSPNDLELLKKAIQPKK